MHKLDAVPLFKDSGLDLSGYASMCRWRRFDPEEVLLDFEDDTDDLHLVIAGEVRVVVRTVSGREMILGDMKAGDYFGELSAIDGVKRSANVTAKSRGEAAVMPASVFKKIVYASPAVADRVMRLLTARVRSLNERLLEKTVLELRHRLYAELLRLSSPRAGDGAVRVLSPPPFHHDLAARIGCRREQITRELGALKQEGLIETTRGAILLAKPGELQARVDAALRDG